MKNKRSSVYLKNGEAHKICSVCGKGKPLAEFYPIYKEGLLLNRRAECKECSKRMTKEYRLANKTITQARLQAIKIRKSESNFTYKSIRGTGKVKYTCRECGKIHTLSWEKAYEIDFKCPKENEGFLKSIKRRTISYFLKKCSKETFSIDLKQVSSLNIFNNKLKITLK